MNTALKDIREAVEKTLGRMLQTNPAPMDYYKRYREFLANNDHEKDRATAEQTFAAFEALAQCLGQENVDRLKRA
jgi:type I restriction enzyme, R subunit